ncbi:MAG: hypothetical protein WCL00_00225 [Bacteroidota bacterium]
MKVLIEDLKERLLQEVPAAKYIDEDWGQLDYYNPNQPVKWPCILLDITQIPWTNEGKHVQLGVAAVSIKVADMRLSNTNVKAPESQRTKAASFFDILDDIHKALHGWTAGSQYGPLTRLMTRKIGRDDGIREFELIYATEITDDSAKIKTKDYPMTAQKIKVVVEKLTVQA